MTRDELIEFLTRVVRHKLITSDRAAELLLAFDNGTLDPSDLPEEQEDDDLVVILPWVVSALVILLRRLGYSANPQRLRIPDGVRRVLQEALRIEFQIRSRTLAAELIRSGDVNAWQRGMAKLIKRNMVENAVTGAGRILTVSELSALEPLAQGQMAFLARFADQIALGNLIGEPVSEAQIASRSELYGRMGLALNSYFEELAAEYGPGWVVDFVSRDDNHTCSNCIADELGGPYLPGQGPMVAESCFGGMRCRCRRRARFDPAAYARLTGEPVVTTTARRTVRAA